MAASNNGTMADENDSHEPVSPAKIGLLPVNWKMSANLAGA